MISVTLDNGEVYDVKTLLADGDSNAKLSKSDASGKGILTYGLSLAPGNLSGFEVCASRSEGCTKACLYSAGMGQVHNVQKARIAKTKAFFQDRNTFKDMLIRELNSAENKGYKVNKRIAVRLNVLSDIMWEKVFPDIFRMFTNVQFYDYTKHAKRMMQFCSQEDWPSNYHLTFSRSESNQDKAISILKQKGNVAIVFDSKNLPKTWYKFKVINGDLTDLRFLDGKSKVIGLYAKGKGKKDNSGFVVETKRISLL